MRSSCRVPFSVCRHVLPSEEIVACSGIAQDDASGFANGPPGSAVVAFDPRKRSVIVSPGVIPFTRKNHQHGHPRIGSPPGMKLMLRAALSISTWLNQSTLEVRLHRQRIRRHGDTADEDGRESESKNGGFIVECSRFPLLPLAHTARIPLMLQRRNDCFARLTRQGGNRGKVSFVPYRLVWIQGF